ncbi:unnamed protein product [Sympodiomycopsis kandeliae]
MTDVAVSSQQANQIAAPGLSAESSRYIRVSSEDLEDFEDEAVRELATEDEDVSEATEIDQLFERASIEYPPERIKTMRRSLRLLGVQGFIRQEVDDDTSILNLLVAFGVLLPKVFRQPETGREILLPILTTALQRIYYTRENLAQYNTVSDVLRSLTNSKPNSIVVLTGAGVSTSAGIPDFRSENGIYAQLQDRTEFQLDDPSDMFDKEVFLTRPEVFYAFAKDIYPSNFKPSPAHRFIKLLEDKGKLLRNYTQNIDTLEHVAGIKKVLNCHGSFATASCVTCDYKAPGASIKEEIFRQQVPLCPQCSTERPTKRRKTANDDDDENDTGMRTGILKPDIVFFGEKLSDDFDHALLADRDKAGLLIVIGSTLSVAPVSKVVGHLPHSAPTILINRTPVRERGLDIVLLGDADFIVEWLSHKLGWKLPTPQPDVNVVGGESAVDSGTSTPKQPIGVTDFEPTRVGESHIWLFPGAEYNPEAEESEDDDDDDDDDDENAQLGDEGEDLLPTREEVEVSSHHAKEGGQVGLHG